MAVKDASNSSRSQTPGRLSLIPTPQAARLTCAGTRLLKPLGVGVSQLAGRSLGRLCRAAGLQASKANGKWRAGEPRSFAARHASPPGNADGAGSRRSGRPCQWKRARRHTTCSWPAYRVWRAMSCMPATRSAAGARYTMWSWQGRCAASAGSLRAGAAPAMQACLCLVQLAGVQCLAGLGRPLLRGRHRPSLHAQRWCAAPGAAPTQRLACGCAQPCCAVGVGRGGGGGSLLAQHRLPHVLRHGALLALGHLRQRHTRTQPGYGVG